jgi:hypothetical protein
MNNGSDIPANENTERPNGSGLAASGADGALDVPPQVQFDRVVALAAVLLDMPITALILVDRFGKWFKASSGSDALQTAGEIQVCRRAMGENDNTIVLDARLNPLFADIQQALQESNVRFCAGSKLNDARGEDLGAMCIISSEPRSDFLAAEKTKLKCLADIVCLGIELNRHVYRARTAAAEQIRALREANSRIKNSLTYATLLAEVQSAEMPTDRMTVIATAAWRQYAEASGVLMGSMRSLRERMTVEEYRNLLALMPGFAI